MSAKKSKNRKQQTTSQTDQSMYPMTSVKSKVIGAIFVVIVLLFIAAQLFFPFGG